MPSGCQAVRLDYSSWTEPAPQAVPGSAAHTPRLPHPESWLCLPLVPGCGLALWPHGGLLTFKSAPDALAHIQIFPGTCTSLAALAAPTRHRCHCRLPLVLLPILVGLVVSALWAGPVAQERLAFLRKLQVLGLDLNSELQGPDSGLVELARSSEGLPRGRSMLDLNMASCPTMGCPRGGARLLLRGRECLTLDEVVPTSREGGVASTKGVLSLPPFTAPCLSLHPSPLPPSALQAHAHNSMLCTADLAATACACVCANMLQRAVHWLSVGVLQTRVLGGERQKGARGQEERKCAW